MQDILVHPAGVGDPTPLFLPLDLGPWVAEQSPPQTTLRKLLHYATDAERLFFPGKLTASELRVLKAHNEYKRVLEAKMARAESYEDWKVAASELDKLEQHENWKTNDHSDEYYNPDLIASRLHELENARVGGDIQEMLYLVRTALSRDSGGIGNASLYNHSYVGTKKLAERYVQASVDLIEALVSRSNRGVESGLVSPMSPMNTAAADFSLPDRQILEELHNARRSFGRSALILSGGSIFGMAHIGVLKALFDKKLLPRIISGTSAGSIVASVVCTRKDDEIPAILEQFAHGDLAVFTDKDNPDSWLTNIRRMILFGSWLDSRNLQRVMREAIGEVTFREAFNRTRRILNITVSSKPGLQLPSLLNYITAPNVIIWSAVVASCSIPGIFTPASLLVRDEAAGEAVPWDPAKQLWLDGSVDNDIPVQRLGEMLNVNHFIVSQANPHIAVFVGRGGKSFSPETHSAESKASYAGRLQALLGIIRAFGKSEATFILEALAESGVFPGSLTILVKMLTQEYTADVNIVPRMSLWWARHLIRNPTPEFMLEACQVGERATWPALCRIENTVAVELALDRAVWALRERIAFGESQVNLRRLITGYDALGVQRDEGAAKRRHNRRGSGGSIQLSARRRLNREELETILSEGEQDPEHGSDQPSLASRRGVRLSLSTLFDGKQLPPYRGPVKQNSLQQLPVPKSTSPRPLATRKHVQGYGVGDLTMTNIVGSAYVASKDDDDESESLYLLMKPRRRGSPAPDVLSTVQETSESARHPSVTSDDSPSDPEPYGRTSSHSSSMEGRITHSTNLAPKSPAEPGL